MRCHLTRATGYISGRLVPELLAAGYPVQCTARDPGKLSGRPWSGDVGIAAADALDRTAVRQVLDALVAYYLNNSLSTGASFEQRDREAAGIFADASMSARVSRIVYLGGIVSGDGSGLSPHLRSRAEVGDILLASGVPAAALQETPRTSFPPRLTTTQFLRLGLSTTSSSRGLSPLLDRPCRAYSMPPSRAVARDGSADH